MIVVSDASPLIYLSWIGQLGLLHHLYGQIVVPELVYEEVTGHGDDRPGSKEVKSAEWLSIRTCRDLQQFEALKRMVDFGKAQAIAIALELNAETIIVDDMKGRILAKEMGLAIIGAIGVLLEAKRKGFLESVKNQIEKLRNETSFRVSDAVVRIALKEANEK